MKHFDCRLSYLTDRQKKVKQESLELLKDFIKEHGEIDCTEDEDMQIQATLYCDGYFAAMVKRVYIDNERGLVIETNEFDYDEFSDAFTNDTLLDILCSVAY